MKTTNTKDNISYLQQVLKDLENRVQNENIRAPENDQGDYFGARHSTPLNDVRNKNETRVNHYLEEPERVVQVRSKVHMKPQYFDGGEDFEEYISQFEILAELYAWPTMKSPCI